MEIISWIFSHILSITGIGFILLGLARLIYLIILLKRIVKIRTRKTNNHGTRTRPYGLFVHRGGFFFAAFKRLKTGDFLLW